MRRVRALGAVFMAVALGVAGCTSGGAGGGGIGGGIGGAVPQRNEWGGIEPAATIPQGVPPTGSGCFSNVSAGTRTVTGCGAGVQYTVTVPPKCLQFKCGLIFDIHGMTMSAASQNGGTNMRALGTQEGYVVVQPTASGGNPAGTGIQGTIWDFGAGAASPAVAQAVRTAAQAWKVDDRRIHVTGFSMGGSMTWFLRCRLGNFLASVAPMSFSNTSGGRCPNIKTPTLYQMGGARDSLSGDTSMQNGLSGTMRNMVQAYNLGAGREVAQGNGYTWRMFDAGGMHFETLVHNYTTTIIGGHCIFGAPQPGLLCSCKGSQPIAEGRNAMDFFKAYPKRA
jgi:hypothetical protein